jgi:hypothetical protein
LTILLTGAALLLLANSLFADDGSVEASRDSVPDPVSNSPISLVGITRDYGLEQQPDFKHSPRTSVLYSTIAPGLGQARNGRWAKASAFVAVGALLVASTVIESDRADRYLHLSRNATTPEDAEAYFADYARHSDARDRMVWWTVGFWILNMLDAYIDGHLFAFSRQ